MGSAPTTVVMIEDSPAEAELYRAYLTGAGLRILHGVTAQAGLRLLEREHPAALLLDLGLPDMDGLDLLARIRGQGFQASVIIITAEHRADRVVSAMRLGAFDFLVKPFSADRLQVTLRNALEHRRLNELVETYRAPFEDGFHGMIGTSAPMQAVYRMIESAASSTATVFISGASGTGKELCASAIHLASPRRAGPFIPLNCAAIPKEVMESEIFGHVKGAFTGATSDRQGAVEAADGGTLFLDEVCEMDLGLQAKLLRFVNSRHFRRLGETRERTADIRFVCATNRDPAAMVAEGRFREDLYYRLHVIPIHLPPLVQREADTLTIARHLLRLYAQEEGKGFGAFSPEAEAVIAAYAWPGNVRELQNVLRKAVVLHDGETLSADMIAIPAPAPDFAAGPSHAVRALRVVEREAIEGALAACQGNITAAARLLEINPSTIYRKRQHWGGLRPS